MTEHPSPPGWHPDPAASAKERYWDGTRWTDALREAPGSDLAATSGPGVSAAPGPSSDGPQRQSSRWVWVGVVGVILVLAALGGVVLLLGDDDSPDVALRPEDAPAIDGQQAPDDAPSSDDDDGGLVEVALRSGEEELFAVSPDGAMYLAEGANEGEACLFDLEAAEPRFCAALPPLADTRLLAWSDDGSTIAICEGVAVYAALRGGDLVVIDVASETSRFIDGPVPIDDDTRADGTARAFIRPALSPDGGQLAKMAFRADGAIELVVTDRTTATSRTLTALSRFAWQLHWSADDRLWVTELEGNESRLLAYDLDGQQVATFPTMVDLGGSTSWASLVQDADGIGLLNLETFAATGGGETERPHFAVIDLADGRIAPVLPPGNQSVAPEQARYWGLQSARLSPDGRTVTIAYQVGTRAFEDNATTDVQVVRVQVDDLLSGIDDVEVLIEEASAAVGLERPVLMTMESPNRRTVPLPAGGSRVTVPVWQVNEDAAATQFHPRLFLRVRADD